MTEGSKLFRLKTTWLKPNDLDEGLSKVKTEEIVQAVSYTDAEAIAFKIAENENRAKCGDIDIEITRIKPCDFVYQPCLITKEGELTAGLIETYFEGEENSGEGLYQVNYLSITVDEKTGKDKTQKESIFVPASDNKDAYNCATSYLKSCSIDFIIKDIKFDKASSILLSPDYYQGIVDHYEQN